MGLLSRSRVSFRRRTRQGSRSRGGFNDSSRESLRGTDSRTQSSGWKSIRPSSGTLLPLGDESGVELYYNVAVAAWCQITPDLQVIDPFRDPVSTSLLFGLRARIDF